MTGLQMIPAAPGWRAALFCEVLFGLVRSEDGWREADAVTDADLLSVLEVAPVVAWGVTEQGMRPATPKGVLLDRALSVLLLAPPGEFDGVVLDDATELEWSTARSDKDLFAWARHQWRTRLRLVRLAEAHDRVAEAVLRGEVDPDLPGLLVWAMGEGPKPGAGEITTPEAKSPRPPEITTGEITTPAEITTPGQRGLFDGERRGRKPGGEVAAERAGRLLASMLSEVPGVSVQAFAEACRRQGIVTRATEREQRRAVRQALAAIPGVRIEGDRIVSTCSRVAEA